MSAESQDRKIFPRIRSLRDNEKALIAKLVQGLPVENLIMHDIQDTIVEEMNDGGMESLRFVRAYKPCFKRQLSEATFSDIDEVPVSVTINLDQDGNLYELDIWKADNSPLVRFPKPDEVFER